MKVLIMDTEGFGGIDESSNHDSRIFLFSILLSSFFIYNSVGRQEFISNFLSIDERALQTLSLIINLSKQIKFRINQARNQNEDPADHFPSFLWIIRDFALRLLDTEGKKISSKEYLEKSLNIQKGVSDIIEEKNKIRRLLKHFFQDRDCYTLVRPVEDEKLLQVLNTLPDS